MDFVNLIGKHFDQVGLSKNDYSIEFEDDEWMKEEGIEPWWTVNSSDGSFQMKLDKDKIIQTIWLYPVNGKFRLNDYSINSVRDSIRVMLGVPESSGDNIKSILNNDVISWDRFRFQNHYLHFEFDATKNSLRLITIMAMKVIVD